jgi:hypothetical protein
VSSKLVGEAIAQCGLQRGRRDGVESDAFASVQHGGILGAPPTRFGTSGVAFIPTPGLENFDFSLAKQLSIRERVTLRVQCEASKCNVLVVFPLFRLVVTISYKSNNFYPFL